MFRVLAVDDDPEVLVMYQRLLASIGVAVDTVPNASEALKLLHNTCHRHYGLLLTDLVMPGLNGDALARVVKVNRRMEVIMVSAQPWDEDAARHTIRYFQKPLEGVATFLECIEAARRKSEQELERCPCAQDYCAFRPVGMPMMHCPPMA